MGRRLGTVVCWGWLVGSRYSDFHLLAPAGGCIGRTAFRLRSPAPTCEPSSGVAVKHVRPLNRTVSWIFKRTHVGDRGAAAYRSDCGQRAAFKFTTFQPLRGVEMSRWKTVGIFVIVSVLLAPVSHAMAAVVTINETIDIEGYVSNASIFETIPTATIASGDSVDMTVNFANNKALKMGDGSETFRAWLDGVGNGSMFTIANVQVTFLGFQGTGGASSTLNKASESNGAAHIGPQFSNFLSTGQSIQFTGYHVTYNVTSLQVDPNTYANIWFIQSGNDLQVVDSTVPEPTTLAIWGTLGGLGMIATRRRRKQAA